MRAVVGGIASVLLGAAVGSSAVAGGLFGSKGEFSTSFLSNLEYDPSSACYKPTKPFTDDQSAWDMYRQDGERYIDCLKDAAESDIGYARGVIQDGYNEAVDEFIEEVERGY